MLLLADHYFAHDFFGLGLMEYFIALGDFKRVSAMYIRTGHIINQSMISTLPCQRNSDLP